MPIAHIFAGVVCWTAKNHGQKSLLFADLAVHVDAMEKVRNPRVGEDPTVKGINNRIHRYLTTQVLI